MGRAFFILRTRQWVFSTCLSLNLIPLSYFSDYISANVYFRLLFLMRFICSQEEEEDLPEEACVRQSKNILC